MTRLAPRALKGAVAALLALPLLLLGTAPPAGAADGATVTVVHGVPGLPVDVYVNGEVTLPDFQPGTVTSPLSLPAGSYEIAVCKAGDAATAAPAISGTVELPAGANACLVAHLDAAGTPALTPYVNDTSAVPAGQARLVVRHDAAAPAVDVLAGGQPVLTGLTNPGEKALVTSAGTVQAAVAAAGTTTPVLGPTPLTLVEGRTTVVYAVGSLSAGTLQLLTQVVGAAPTGAAAGSGGQAAGDAGNGLVIALALGAAGALLLAVGARATVRGRVRG